MMDDEFKSDSSQILRDLLKQNRSLRTLLAETDFPDELIMNYWPDRFFDYLRIQR